MVSVVSGSVLMVGSVSQSAVGMDEVWLGSGFGVGLALASYTRPMVNGESLFGSTFSTKVAKSPRGSFTGRRALECLRVVWKNTQSELSR